MRNLVSQALKCGTGMLLLASSSAFAEINFNGFASIRATAADSDGGQTPFSFLKGDGDISFKDESLFAIQARADLGEGLSATVQFMAEGQNDFDVEAKWAYLSYDINDTHRLSAGRFANPIFFQSQYEKVGYAHNFARLPVGVYIGFDFSTIEGIAVDSTFFVGDYTLETKVLYGNWNGEVFVVAAGGDVSIGLKDVMSFNATLSGDWWKMYAGGFTSELEGGTFDNIIRAFGAPGANAALALGAPQSDVDEFYDTIVTDGKDGIYWFAGFGIDYNNFVVDFEYVDYGIRDAVNPLTHAWYASVGYRFDNSMILIHTEDYNRDIKYEYFNGLSNPVLNGTARAIMDALGAQEFDGSGITYRYDFHPSAALKIDYFRGENTLPTVGDYTIWSVGVDMVF